MNCSLLSAIAMRKIRSLVSILELFEQRTAPRRFGTVGGRQKRFHEDVLFEQAALHQARDTRIDHRRRSAQIGLVTFETLVEMLLGEFVDETACTGPRIVVTGFRQSHGVREIRMLVGERMEQVVVIQLFA